MSLSRLCNIYDLWVFLTPALAASVGESEAEFEPSWFTARRASESLQRHTMRHTVMHVMMSQVTESHCMLFTIVQPNFLGLRKWLLTLYCYTVRMCWFI